MVIFSTFVHILKLECALLKPKLSIQIWHDAECRGKGKSLPWKNKFLAMENWGPNHHCSEAVYWREGSLYSTW